mmetsp:Transcript_2908/g.9705  ORF Transcript_2908/g.9705 Transcript_2908/m.9705 type:complete len:239 (+) Transcript_2908:214-930(+)
MVPHRRRAAGGKSVHAADDAGVSRSQVGRGSLQGRRRVERRPAESRGRRHELAGSGGLGGSVRLVRVRVDDRLRAALARLRRAELRGGLLDVPGGPGGADGDLPEGGDPRVLGLEPDEVSRRYGYLGDDQRPRERGLLRSERPRRHPRGRRGEARIRRRPGGRFQEGDGRGGVEVKVLLDDVTEFDFALGPAPAAPREQVRPQATGESVRLLPASVAPHGLRPRPERRWGLRPGPALH